MKKRALFTLFVLTVSLVLAQVPRRFPNGIRPATAETTDLNGGKTVAVQDANGILQKISVANLASALSISTGNLSQEEVEDILANLITSATHSGAAWTYDDAAGTLSINTSASDTNDFPTGYTLVGTQLTLTIPNQTDVIIDLSSLFSDRVPYTGASSNLELGSNSLFANGIEALSYKIENGSNNASWRASTDGAASPTFRLQYATDALPNNHITYYTFANDGNPSANTDVITKLYFDNNLAISQLNPTFETVTIDETAGSTNSVGALVIAKTNATNFAPGAGYGALWFNDAGHVKYGTSAGGSSNLFNLGFDFSGFTAARTFVFPNKSGTIALLDDIPSGGSDDLGNHQATQNLDMRSFAITNIEDNILIRDSGGYSMNLIKSTAATILRDNRAYNGSSTGSFEINSTTGVATYYGNLNVTGDVTAAGGIVDPSSDVALQANLAVANAASITGATKALTTLFIGESTTGTDDDGADFRFNKGDLGFEIYKETGPTTGAYTLIARISDTGDPVNDIDLADKKYVDDQITAATGGGNAIAQGSNTLTEDLVLTTSAGYGIDMDTTAGSVAVQSGTGADGAGIVISDNSATLFGVSDSEIEAAGATQIITKSYLESKLIDQTPQAYTTSRTLTSADINKVIEGNSASALEFTVTNTMGAVAGNVLVFEQLGAGVVRPVAGSGVTFKNTRETNGQYTSVTYKMANDGEWYALSTSGAAYSPTLTYPNQSNGNTEEVDDDAWSITNNQNSAPGVFFGSSNYTLQSVSDATNGLGVTYVLELSAPSGDNGSVNILTNQLRAALTNGQSYDIDIRYKIIEGSDFKMSVTNTGWDTGVLSATTWTTVSETFTYVTNGQIKLESNDDSSAEASRVRFLISIKASAP